MKYKIWRFVCEKCRLCGYFGKNEVDTCIKTGTIKLNKCKFFVTSKVKNRWI